MESGPPDVKSSAACKQSHHCCKLAYIGSIIQSQQLVRAAPLNVPAQKGSQMAQLEHEWPS
eukprot:365047-Chlamydomonas_euryale.AAC.4